MAIIPQPCNYAMLHSTKLPGIETYFLAISAATQAAIKESK